MWTAPRRGATGAVGNRSANGFPPSWPVAGQALVPPTGQAVCLGSTGYRATCRASRARSVRQRRLVGCARWTLRGGPHDARDAHTLFEARQLAHGMVHYGQTGAVQKRRGGPYQHATFPMCSPRNTACAFAMGLVPGAHLSVFIPPRVCAWALSHANMGCDDATPPDRSRRYTCLVRESSGCAWSSNLARLPSDRSCGRHESARGMGAPCARPASHQ